MKGDLLGYVVVHESPSEPISLASGTQIFDQRESAIEVRNVIAKDLEPKDDHYGIAALTSALPPAARPTDTRQLVTWTHRNSAEFGVYAHPAIEIRVLVDDTQSSRARMAWILQRGTSAMVRALTIGGDLSAYDSGKNSQW